MEREPSENPGQIEQTGRSWEGRKAQEVQEAGGGVGPKIRDLGLSRISLQVSRIGSGTHREANRTFRFDVGAKIFA